jgi:hypothetical protein
MRATAPACRSGYPPCPPAPLRALTLGAPQVARCRGGLCTGNSTCGEGRVAYDENPLCEMCFRNETVVFSSWFGRCVRCDATNGPYILAGLFLLCERAALSERAGERETERARHSPLSSLVPCELLTRLQDLGLDAGEATTGSHWPERIAR